ncbi:hypothetical protein FOA43_000155 [Brettanomyces nanus]|uniref:Uncharacterized protein n=1 Tax=Eeniella nana TaxID=13502 RepID=A0A875RWL5_EENNA|nr:uncharacterized protein FOA43_000155 [Brettanomyces nanus]QPG72853.1 hypothetical protein FOA43_000155 [Brettanomyces nanus]
MSDFTLDYIPLLDDDDIDDDSVTMAVKKEIEREMAKIANTKQLHIKVVEQFPDGNIVLPYDIPITSKGMGIPSLAQKYTSFNGGSMMTKEDKLKLLASYSMLRSRSLDILQHNSNLVGNQWIMKLDQLERLNKQADSELNLKRRRIDELLEIRKRRCLEFKPINEFMRNRWNEKIDELIVVGVQLAERQLQKD